jgi:hypothetical protein
MASSTVAQMGRTTANTLSINTPVRLPGVVLLPGSYTFEAGPIGLHPDIVRVTSASNRKLHYLGFTQRVSRPKTMGPATVLSFEEAPAGAPKPIDAWFPLGSKVGHGFLYR